MAKIGIFGGSFNPPHLGHILAVREFQRQLSLDRVLLVPSAVPPHKRLTNNFASAQERLEMTRLAARELPFAEVCDLELHREGPSYTADTIAELRSRYPKDRLILLMGTDMLLSFTSWYHPERIVQEASLAVALRDDTDHEKLHNCAKALKKELGAKVTLMDNRILPHSSTSVRAMLAFDCGESYLDPAVFAYLREKGLYRYGQCLRGLPFPELSAVSLNLHNPRRVPHVVGCSQTARRLAVQYGANPEDAERAGILHDVTKALNGEEQLKLCERYDILLDKFERENPKLLHAKTGAVIAREVFGENEAVCSAINWHTTGRADMTLLEKIIYLADYMEPNRDFEGVEELRRLTASDLDAAMRLGLSMSIRQLRENHRCIDKNSEAALRFLKERM